MSAPTPGPWAFRKSGTIAGFVSAPTEHAILEVTATSAAGRRDFDANARLIAAAPELLDALKRIAAKGCGPENLGAYYLTRIAQDAIAKAEGRA